MNVFINSIGVPRTARNKRIYTDYVGSTYYNNGGIGGGSSPVVPDHPVISDGLRQLPNIVWIEGYTFSFSSVLFGMLGMERASISTQLTLSASNATYGRYDTVVINSVRQYVVKEGTPSATPRIPQATPGTEIYVTSFFVGAGTTEYSGISEVVAYDENLEWTITSSGVYINADSTNSPSHGTKCLEVGTTGGVGLNDTVVLTSSVVLNVIDFNILSYQLRLKSAVPIGHSLYVCFMLGGVDISSYRLFVMNKYDITNWQTFAEKLSMFNIVGPQFDAIKFKWIKSGEDTNYEGFYLDLVKLQSGLSQPTSIDLSEYIKKVDVPYDIDFGYTDFELGTAKAYTLDLKAQKSYLIKGIVLSCDTGTLTGFAVKINGTVVTSLSSLTITSTITETLATGANTVNLGDKVTIELSTGYSGTPTIFEGKLLRQLI